MSNQLEQSNTESNSARRIAHIYTQLHTGHGRRRGSWQAENRVSALLEFFQTCQDQMSITNSFDPWETRNTPHILRIEQAERSDTVGIVHNHLHERGYGMGRALDDFFNVGHKLQVFANLGCRRNSR